MYSAGVTGENYLRGVQETDASGKVRYYMDCVRQK